MMLSSQTVEGYITLSGKQRHIVPQYLMYSHKASKTVINSRIGFDNFRINLS